MKRCFNGFGRSLNAGLYLGYLLNPSQRAHTRVALLRAPLQRRGRGHMTGIRARIKAPNLIQPKTCDLLHKSNNLGSNAADAASLQLVCFHSTFQRSAAPDHVPRPHPRRWPGSEADASHARLRLVWSVSSIANLCGHCSCVFSSRVVSNDQRDPNMRSSASVSTVPSILSSVPKNSDNICSFVLQ